MDKGLFADDVVDHAKVILADCGGHSSGSYRSFIPLFAFTSIIEEYDFPVHFFKSIVFRAHYVVFQSKHCFSQSTGIDVIRKHVAEYITRRDGGIPSNPEDILLSGGASESIRVNV